MPAQSLNTTYTQNFDSLASTGTPAWANDTTLAGWYAARAAGGPNWTNYVANDGSSNTGALYSYGVAGTNPLTDRALGSLSSGGPGTIYYGIRLVNDTSSTILALNVSYRGEQWRNGGNTTAQSLSFSYQTGTTVTDLIAGTWTAVAALNFTGPIATATAAALDGNAPTNRVTINQTFNIAGGLTPGQEIMLRWEDINDPGNDHGLAIDDISISTSAPVVTPGVTITESGGSTSVQEGSTTADTYTIALNTTPAAPVTIEVRAADGQTLVSSDGITFSNSLNIILNDTTAQTISVRAVNDTYVENATHRGTINHFITASTDPNYPAYPNATLILPQVNVNITDNDTGAISLEVIGRYSTGQFSTTGGPAEIPAYDPASQRLYVVNGFNNRIDVLSLANPTTPTLITSITPNTTTATPGFAPSPNSVAIRNGVVAVAVAITNSTTNGQEAGQVEFYNAATGAFLNAVTVGFLPDMLAFTPDGTRLLVANEGEPTNDYLTDPEGSVSIINFGSGNPEVSVANTGSATVQTATFTSFNGNRDALRAAGVRVFGSAGGIPLNSTVSQDLEPEYITFSPDSSTAYVALQENNAIAVVNIATATVTDIRPLGFLNFSTGGGFDASDRDRTGAAAGGGIINLRNWPVLGMFQPDAIAAYQMGGITYIVTANEGDARGYTGLNEETRISAIGAANLDAVVFPNATSLVTDAQIGRLTVTNQLGRTTADGLGTDATPDYESLVMFGTRSFSIWNAGTFARVFDSGSDFERITAGALPNNFNPNHNGAGGNTLDNRSDDKGPEPEGLVLGTIAGRTYAFVGLERVGGVMVYDITNPLNVTHVQYINPRNFGVTPEAANLATVGDLGPEGLIFIPAAQSPNGRDLLVVANEVSGTVTIMQATPLTHIRDIQGSAHLSPLQGQTVRTAPAIVTAIASNGFYMQDPDPDANDATSEAIFVFTNTAPTVAVGDSVEVKGRVDEFRPGGNVNNLTITQVNATVTGAAIKVLSSGNTLPAAIVIGNGGRVPPLNSISGPGNVETTPGRVFSPSTQAIDFYESLEGMRVQINNPVVVGPTNSFGEIWVLGDNGINSTASRTARGGIVIGPNDFNPERIQIDEISTALTNPLVNVGATLSTITGVVSYNFNNYEVLVSVAPTIVTNPLAAETTNLAPADGQLTISNYNVLNLSPNDPSSKFASIASQIVNNLRSPDILALQEIQDNNGTTNDSVVDATTTYNNLIAAIAAAGGPTYQFRQIDPVDDQDGGAPGGNIRVGFLFNPGRVQFVDRPGGGSLVNTTVTNVGGKPQLSASPGRIDPTNTAWNSSRKPLVGEFVFQGQTVFVINNHLNSKGGDQPLFGPNQPPTLTTEAQRIQQAQALNNFVKSILAIDANANIVVLGDLNDFTFSEPLNVLRGVPGGVGTPVLYNLYDTIPANQRYSYIFQGNSQTLDHILVSNNMLGLLDGFDPVNINSEFATQVSDHDPLVARFGFTPRSTVDSASNTLQLTGAIQNGGLRFIVSSINTNFSNEIGLFVVDDAAGTVNGIAPGAAGYTQAALARGRVIVSALSNNPNGFNPGQLQRFLGGFNPNQRVAFYLVQNNTTDAVLAGANATVLFGNATGNNRPLQISDLGNNALNLAWRDQLGNPAFTNVVIRTEIVSNTPVTVGAAVQGNREQELIDLRGITGTRNATFIVNREAAFNNLVGFFRVDDVNGTIAGNTPGAANFNRTAYLNAALNDRRLNIDLTVANQGSATFTGQFTGGSIFAPFIIANGNLEQGRSGASPVYFPFLGANANRVDHIRLLADNTFGFEDLPNGGDFDYNDMVVRVSFS